MSCLNTPACKHIICMMMAMFMVVSAATFSVMVVMMLMSAATLFVMVLMMFMSAATLFVMVVMMMLMSAAALSVMVVMMVLMSAAALSVMVMMFLKKFFLKRIYFFHSIKNLLSIYLIPRCRDNRSFIILLFYHCKNFCKLLL